MTVIVIKGDMTVDVGDLRKGDFFLHKDMLYQRIATHALGVGTNAYNLSRCNASKFSPSAKVIPVSKVEATQGSRVHDGN